uniref:Ig-like domain-containing protein n=1 Tax=Canis lupus dingo TaxID=286419 RepID=A0A8C0R527_CANLU
NGLYNLYCSTNAGVTQNPRHLVRRTGQEAILTCSPEKGHSYFYWYQQFLGEGLKFMIYLQKETILDQSGMPKKRFSTEFSEDGLSILKIQPAELGDSAVYFCASTKATSMQSPILSMHKRPPCPTSETAVGWGREGGTSFD